MPPPLGGSSGGLPSRVEYLSPQGVLLPLVYGTTASLLWLELPMSMATHMRHQTRMMLAVVLVVMLVVMLLILMMMLMMLVMMLMTTLSIELRQELGRRCLGG